MRVNEDMSNYWRRYDGSHSPHYDDKGKVLCFRNVRISPTEPLTEQEMEKLVNEMYDPSAWQDENYKQAEEVQEHKLDLGEWIVVWAMLFIGGALIGIAIANGIQVWR